MKIWCIPPLELPRRIGISNIRPGRRAGFGLAALLLVPVPLWAALGGSPLQLGTEGVAQPARSLLQLPAGVQQKTLVTPQGVVVTEWYTTNLVFALSWKGSTVPDLSRFLGPNYPDYRQAVQARGRRLGLNAPLEVRSSALVAHTAGHSGAFFGSAYLPGQLPPNLSPHALVGVQP